jgi:hypothetical protein
MNTCPENHCNNLIIQPHPVDTLANIAHIMAFFKEFYEVGNPDFYMSDDSRTGFYILLAIVQQAAEFETKRLSGELKTDETPFKHEPMPDNVRKELDKLFSQMLGNTSND